MSPPSLLFIDFDGVICDSAAECLFSSWVAYDRLTDSDPADGHRSGRSKAVPVALRRGFLRLRPFIRAGDDYVLIQRLLASGRSPPDQEAFDRERQEVGAATLTRYADALSSVRRKLLTDDREHWLRLNPLYDGVAELLRAADWDCTRILSTKSPEFIQAILAFHQVPVPPRAILHATDVSKLAIVAGVLDEGPAEHAVLVDDQDRMLLGNDDPRIVVYLATWGYVKPEWPKPEWRNDARVLALELAGFGALVTRR